MVNNLKHFARRVSTFLLKHKTVTPLHYIALFIARFWHPYVNHKLSNSLKILYQLNKQEAFQKISLTGTAVLQLYTNNYIYLIPTGNISVNSLAKNYHNWTLLNHSDYKHLVNYWLQKISTTEIVYYKIEKLNPIEDINTAYNSIYKELIGEIQENDFQYIDFKMIIHKLESLVSFKLDDLIPRLYKPSRGYVGMLHGDLTSNNILRNTAGNHVIIDLDRLTFKGPQVLDEIHYWFCELEKKYKLQWLIILPSILEGKIPWVSPSRFKDMAKLNQLLTIYFFFRINAEVRDGIKLPTRYLQSLRSCLLAILTVQRSGIE
ncbi:MAG: hypothetical protein COA74_00860 [Gammaproteobacteria bacterium]|nr:MAG: hypothetical protein COA74_00860 [Gammaproteobacteria bacterium]